MPRQRSSKCSLTASPANSRKRVDAGKRLLKRRQEDAGAPGGGDIPQLELSCLTEILAALASTVKKQGSGNIPFPLFLPQSLVGRESSWREPRMLLELIKRCIVIRTAFTLSATGSTGWFQVILSIPRVSESGKLSREETMPTTTG